MAEQNDPSRHHFVPAFYLQKWTNFEGKLLRYGKLPSGKVTMNWRVPKSVGCQADLYSFPALGDTSAALEKGLMEKLDDKAGKVIQKIIDQEANELTDADQIWFGHFLLSLLIRAPESVEALKAAALKMWESPNPQTQADYEKAKGPNDPETLEEWLKSDSGIGGHQLGQTIIHSLVMNRAIVDRIRTMNWQVITLSEQVPPLVTSDRPLFSNNGLLKENGQLLLPLSPRHLFAAFTHENYLADVKAMAGEELAVQVRKLSTVRAQNFVYASTTHEREFVGKWLAYERIPTVGEALAKDWLSPEAS